MAESGNEWAEIEKTWGTRVGDALEKMRRETGGATTPGGGNWLARAVVEYCLIAAKEYTEAGFDCFRQGRAHAGLTCFRVVLEYAIRFWWCILDASCVETRMLAWE